MNNIDWKKKLSSRKFWESIAGAVASFLAAFGLSDNVITQVAGIICGVGILAYYIFSETQVDKARINNNVSEDVIDVDIIAEDNTDE